MRRTPGATSALLQKVTSQLKGERVNQNEEEDDLNAYLKSLSQKTAQQKKGVNFEDVGDISISSEFNTSSTQSHKRPLITSGNKFLKKKQADNNAQPVSKFLKKPQVSSASPVPTVSSQVRPETKKSQVVGKSQGRSSTQSALNKASALSNKFAQRSAETRNVFTLETDSSESLHTPRPSTPLGRPRSADSDSFKIGKDGSKFMKKKPMDADTIVTRPRSPQSRSPKSRSPVPVENRQKKKKASNREADTRKSSPFVLKSSLKYSTDIVLSSGEESLAEFMAGIDSSESQKVKKLKEKQGKSVPVKRRGHSPPMQRTPSPDAKPPTSRRSQSPVTSNRSTTPRIGRRSPSPKYHRSRSRSASDSDPGDSLQSEMIIEGKDDGSVSSDDAFQLNLMDVDSLEPVIIAKPKVSSNTEKSKRKSPDKPKKSSTPKEKPKKVKKEKKKPKDDIFSSFGLQTVDDLLDLSPIIEKSDALSVASEVSEIKTQSESEEIHTEKPEVLGRKVSQRSFHSIIESEIHTANTTELKKESYSDDFEDSITEKIGMPSTKASKIKTVSEILSRYMGEDTVAEDYSQEFNSDSESMATVTESNDESLKTMTDSYTNNTESYTYSYSDRGRPTSRLGKKKNMKTAEVQTTDIGFRYQWDSRYSGFAIPDFKEGLGFVDPTPIASHFISPESLEALTGYSPAMLALHDMLRQQLQLTQTFIQSQQYLYKSLSETVECKHKYTTLEETKRYIKKHRKKKLTFKQALKMVEREQGL